VLEAFSQLFRQAASGGLVENLIWEGGCYGEKQPDLQTAERDEHGMLLCIPRPRFRRLEAI
jgi:hypothetical protein